MAFGFADQEHLLVNDPTWGPLCITVGSAPSADPGRRLYRILVWSRDVRKRNQPHSATVVR